MSTPVQPTRPLTSLPPFEVDGPYRRNTRRLGLSPRPLPEFKPGISCTRFARQQLNRRAWLALAFTVSMAALSLLSPDAWLHQVDAALRAVLGLH